MKNLEYEETQHVLATATELDSHWLEDARDIDVYLSMGIKPFRSLTDYLFDQVQDIITINNKYRSKNTLKTLLLNLWINHLADYPTMYSRSPNQYSMAKRYGKLFFKYNRVIPIMDSLEELGYINQFPGYFNHADGIKRRTRALPTQHLRTLFRDFLDLSIDNLHRLPPQEIIILKNKNKIEIDYPNNHWTISKRLNLYRYNNFIQEQEIIVDVPCHIAINASFIKDLAYNLYHRYITIAYHECNPEFSKQIREGKGNSGKIVYREGKIEIEYREKDRDREDKHRDIYTLITTITNKLLVESKTFKDKKDKKDKIRLSDLGINRLVFRIDYSQLHRVFNNSSFGLGGRYYGAFHLNMPQKLRFFTRINGYPGVEYDYKAHHIRMLYHMENIDYRDDPYLALCDSEDERKMYKLVTLVSINAPTINEALSGLRESFRKNGIAHGLKNEELYPLVEKFKQAHKPIAKYLTSNEGIKLQNRDSRITEGLLTSFVRDGIPILPVHDSFVVPDSCEGLLQERMCEFYEKEMKGYAPVIDKKVLKMN
jgi:hypothetical protein